MAATNTAVILLIAALLTEASAHVMVPGLEYEAALAPEQSGHETALAPEHGAASGHETALAPAPGLGAASGHETTLAPAPGVASGMEGTPGPAPEAASWLEMAMAPGPAAFNSECFSTMMKMPDCQTYVAAGSEDKKKPDKECCPALAGLVRSDPSCLCYLLQDKNITMISEMSIDMNKALELPSVCGISTPPLRTCFGMDGFGRGIGGDDFNGGVSSGVGTYELCVYSVVVFISTYFMM